MLDATTLPAHCEMHNHAMFAVVLVLAVNLSRARSLPYDFQDAVAVRDSMTAASSDWDAYTFTSTRWSAFQSQRPVENSMGTASSSQHSQSCPSVTYHAGSEIGHNATCPFDWMVDEDPDRVPRIIVHQVCRGGCRSCGYYRTCVQLKVRSDAYYKLSQETRSSVVNAGCVCLPRLWRSRPSHELELN